MTCAGPFDAEGWRFTVDWEGMRVVLRLDGRGGVRLDDWEGRDRSRLFPEVVRAATALGRRPLALEGVVTALRSDGRPDLDALLSRVRRGSGAPGDAVVALLLTDLLWIDGSSTAAWPLDRRHYALGLVVPPHARIQVPGWVADQGRAFADAAAGLGLSAILARRGSAAYRGGMLSPDRLRIALEERCEVVVLGMAAEPPRAAPAAAGDGVAVALAEWTGESWEPAGWATAPLDGEERRWLYRLAEERHAPDPPGDFGEPFPGARVRWLRPGLVATVRHRGRAADGRLRRPVVVALRDDVDPTWCLRRPPVAPPADTPVVRRFLPTVLPSLPLDD